jgi:hypothetical protein
MDETLSTLLNLYVFTVGRRIFALSKVIEVAKAEKFSALIAHCEAALAHDRETRTLEAKWSGQANATTGSSALRDTDIATDNCLTAIRDAIDSQLRVLKPNDPLAKSGAQLLLELYPSGVGAITSLSYVEELNEVERVLDVLKSKGWKKTVSDLALTRHVALLEELAGIYKTKLNAPAEKIATYAEVRAARHKGQRLMLQAVALILGKHPFDTPEDVASRSALLAPIFEQNEAIRQYLRSRRAVQDVNPETGAIDPSAPAKDEKAQDEKPQDEKPQ